LRANKSSHDKQLEMMPRQEHQVQAISDEQRLTGLLEREQREPKRWFYCSFQTEEGFLGAVILKAHGLVDASTQCHRLKVNPGGEMEMLSLPEYLIPPPEFREVFLTEEQLRKLWPNGPPAGCPVHMCPPLTYRGHDENGENCSYVINTVHFTREEDAEQFEATLKGTRDVHIAELRKTGSTRLYTVAYFLQIPE